MRREDSESGGVEEMGKEKQPVQDRHAHAHTQTLTQSDVDALQVAATPVTCMRVLCALPLHPGFTQAVPGYWGEPGVAASPCEAGSYCPEGVDTFHLCPPGTGSPAGASAVEECVPLAGRYGVPGQPAAECPRGYVCSAGAVRPESCPDNTWSLPGSSAATDCTVSLP